MGDTCVGGMVSDYDLLGNNVVVVIHAIWSCYDVHTTDFDILVFGNVMQAHFPDWNHKQE